MKIILIDNLLLPVLGDMRFLDIHPHLGLLSLGTVARRHGHEAVLYDPKRDIRSGRLAYDETVYDRVVDQVLSAEPDVVGLTTLGASLLFATQVARHIKHKSNIKILMGGPHATMLHRQIMESYPAIDAILRHEAEDTLPAVLDRLNSWEFCDIPGVTWRTRLGVEETPGEPMVADLDKLPLPDYDLYPEGGPGPGLLRVEAGRGCPFACTFCSTAGFFQRRFRIKTAARLVTEMDGLSRRFGVTEFKLEHDLFTVDRRKVVAFCEAVRGRGYTWRVSARVDLVDRELLELMADAGCVGLYYGIETGSRRLQATTKKQLNLDIVDEILDATERAGIEATASFITGFPDEAEDDQRATLDMIGHSFQHSVSGQIPQLHILAPEPGTPLYSQHSERLHRDGYSARCNAKLTSEEDLGEVLRFPLLYPTYYYYSAVMPRIRYILAVELVDVLRRLGRRVLGLLLDRFGGRLSCLFTAYCSWASSPARRPGKASSVIDIVGFVQDELGPDDPLVSLCKYAQAIDALNSAETTFGSAAEPCAFDWDTMYRLAPGVVILDDVHDCPRLLKEGAPAVDPETIQQRTSFLLVAARDSIKSFNVDPATATIAHLFTMPSSCRSLVNSLSNIECVAKLDADYFSKLVSTGALVPCDSVQ